MTRVIHFVKEPEIRNYNIQGIDLELEVNPKIFPPSANGSFFANNINVNKGESVIDVGTGSGLLGILAAKMGGVVSVTDWDNDAIETAKKNAVINNVELDCKQGNLFANYDRKFDVIIANLPQEIVHKNYKEAIGEKLSKSFDGGEFGNKVILQFIDVAKKYMHSKSRCYLLIYTVTNYLQSINKLIENYNVKLVAIESGTAKEFVQDNCNCYRKLNEDGTIRIYKKEGQWWADEYLFELRLKQ